MPPVPEASSSSSSAFAAPPASTWSTYASAALTPALLRILHAAAFSHTSSSALAVLHDVLERYFALLASSAVEYANFSGRAHPAVADVFCALEEAGTTWDELRRWLLEGDAAELTRYADAEMTELGRPLRDSLSLSRPSADLSLFPQLHYLAASPDTFARLSKLRDARDFQSHPQSPSQSSSQTPSPSPPPSLSLSPPPSPPDVANGAVSSPPSVQGDRRWKRRRFNPPDASGRPNGVRMRTRLAEYIPSHLPSLPGDTSDSDGIDEDPSAPPLVLRPPPEVSVPADVPRPKRNPYFEAVTWERSSLSGIQDPTDLPSLTPRTTSPPLAPLVSTRRRTTMPIFARTYHALSTDSSLLPSYHPSNAYDPTHSKKRRLAAALANPDRYTPADSLFANVPVGPGGHGTIVPGPNYLLGELTEEAVLSGGAAIDLKPWPSYSPVLAGLPASGMLQPTLAFRTPGSLLGPLVRPLINSAAAAMASTGGPGGTGTGMTSEMDNRAGYALLRRLTRLEPPALLSDGDHPLVYHGRTVPPPPSHVSSVPVVNPSWRGKGGEVGGGEKEEEETEVDADGKKRRKKHDSKTGGPGTLVYSWDWTRKDASDPELPGRRIRAVREE